MSFWIGLALLVFVIYLSGLVPRVMRMFGYGETGLSQALLNRVNEQQAKMTQINEKPMNAATREIHLSLVEANREILEELVDVFTRIFHEIFADGSKVDDWSKRAVMLSNVTSIFQDAADYLSIVLDDSYTHLAPRRVSAYLLSMFRDYGSEEASDLRKSIEQNNDIKDSLARISLGKLIRFAHQCAEYARAVHLSFAPRESVVEWTRDPAQTRRFEAPTVYRPYYAALKLGLNVFTLGTIPLIQALEDADKRKRARIDGRSADVI